MFLEYCQAIHVILCEPITLIGIKYQNDHCLKNRPIIPLCTPVRNSPPDPFPIVSTHFHTEISSTYFIVFSPIFKAANKLM